MRHHILIGLVAAALWSGAAGAETILSRGNGGQPETLDVHKSVGIPESWIELDLFEGLLAPGPKGELVPGAAESWTVSDDGRTYTFTLRADGKWSDGSPVTAQDFVYSWRRLVDPKTAAPYAYFLDRIVGAKEVRLGQKPPEDLGVRAVDDRTFEVSLVGPTSYFLSMLVNNSTFPVSRANVEKFGDAFARPGNLVSNGAYVLAEDVPQSHMTLRKNPQFHDAANVTIDAVRYVVTEDVDSELSRFQAGELDVTTEVPSQQVPALKQSHPDELHIAPYLGIYFYAINLNHEPWKGSPALRRALSLAVDRDVIIGKVAQGNQTPAYSFVPPGTEGFPAWQPEEAGWTQARRDQEAKALLAQAGYGPDQPLQVKITYNTSENHKKIAVAVAAMWKQKLGVETTLENLEWSTYLTQHHRKEFQDFARTGWIGQYNDANFFLELQRSGIGELSTSDYSNPAYDALLDQASAETDAGKRAAILQQAERLMIADTPVIPLFFYTSRHLVSPAVKGWADNLRDQHPTRWLSVER
ncbi:peptide ABC transporter substrate-binding protein [Inquilinus sp. NPDC058860]|uniref:peptide ABC transporter substrate-binding protein n=1 Tax=Inquilinus sp. NPDC058860 TaxID=3346652 RepID=UPI0036B3723B